MYRIGALGYEKLHESKPGLFKGETVLIGICGKFTRIPEALAIYLTMFQILDYSLVDKLLEEYPERRNDDEDPAVYFEYASEDF